MDAYKYCVMAVEPSGHQRLYIEGASKSSWQKAFEALRAQLVTIMAETNPMIHARLRQEQNLTRRQSSETPATPVIPQVLAAHTPAQVFKSPFRLPISPPASPPSAHANSARQQQGTEPTLMRVPAVGYLAPHFPPQFAQQTLNPERLHNPVFPPHPGAALGVGRTYTQQPIAPGFTSPGSPQHSQSYRAYDAMNPWSPS